MAGEGRRVALEQCCTRCDPSSRSATPCITTRLQPAAGRESALSRGCCRSTAQPGMQPHVCDTHSPSAPRQAEALHARARTCASERPRAALVPPPPAGKLAQGPKRTPARAGRDQKLVQGRPAWSGRAGQGKAAQSRVGPALWGWQRCFARYGGAAPTRCSPPIKPPAQPSPAQPGPTFAATGAPPRRAKYTTVHDRAPARSGTRSHQPQTAGAREGLFSALIGMPSSRCAARHAVLTAQGRAWDPWPREPIDSIYLSPTRP